MLTQHQEPLVDSSKGGVDVVDAMVEPYMGKPPLKRWPSAVFFMMGVAQVNSTTILLLNRGHSAADVRRGIRREMMFALGRGLLMQHLLQRAASPTGLNSDVTAALACATGSHSV